jgi:hypothetical protein
MISLAEYKKYLIDSYHHEIDNTDAKREERKDELERKYSDFQLLRIINDTYSFVLTVLNSKAEKNRYYKIPIDYDTTDYIDLNLTGGWHSDRLITDPRGRIVSTYILKQVFGPLLDFGVREEFREHEEDDIVGYDVDYYIYMQGFPKFFDKINKKYGNYKIKVLFIDFDGVINSLNDIDEDKGVVKEKIEQRIKVLADIARIYNCKIVIESGARVCIDEQTMQINPEAEHVKEIFELFKKYNIECIGRTPEVPIRQGGGYTNFKGVEIRKYLFRHPEIAHYCILDDDDTITLFHWRHSDLEPVQNHLVRPLYYSKDHPEDVCISYKYMNAIGAALQEDNEIRKLALKREPRNYFVY